MTIIFHRTHAMMHRVPIAASASFILFFIVNLNVFFWFLFRLNRKFHRRNETKQKQSKKHNHLEHEWVRPHFNLYCIALVVYEAVYWNDFDVNQIKIFTSAFLFCVCRLHSNQVIIWYQLKKLLDWNKWNNTKTNKSEQLSCDCESVLFV